MPLVTTQPEELAGIGAQMNAQNAVMAAPTTGVAQAAADEVSAPTSAQFAAHVARIRR